MKLARRELRYVGVIRLPFLNPRDQVNRCNNFTGKNENLTQFIKVLLVKVSEILDSSKFVRLFHCQSFALYGISRTRKDACMQFAMVL